MIVQSIMDFFRDVVVNWVSGAASLVGGLDLQGAGSGLGGASAGVGRILALFVSGGLWGLVVGTFVAFLGIYLTTAMIAILGRRGAGK